MEIDITHLVVSDTWEFSGSIATHGQNAGPETWAAAKGEASERPLLTTEDQLEALRAWAGEFGAWDKEEIAAWSDDECNALLIQYVSGNLREIEALCTNDDGEIDWTEVERLEQDGTISGNIWPDGNGKFYFYMGS